jgi:hypothetical protein
MTNNSKIDLMETAPVDLQGGYWPPQLLIAKNQDKMKCHWPGERWHIALGKSFHVDVYLFVEVSMIGSVFAGFVDDGFEGGVGIWLEKPQLTAIKDFRYLILGKEIKNHIAEEHLSISLSKQLGGDEPFSVKKYEIFHYHVSFGYDGKKTFTYCINGRDGGECELAESFITRGPFAPGMILKSGGGKIARAWLGGLECSSV